MHGNVIAAISTPPGKGGVAVIRMSGAGAFEIADRVFLPISGKRIGEYPARVQIYGYIIYNEERIDDGMLTRFPAPHSYTGEDTVEISCHGGILVTRTVLEALLTAGATPAEAGEFTRRAFINGKLSLSEAEGIGTLLEATSHEQIRLSASPARAKLSGAIASIRDGLTSLMSSIYARIDYPDEDLGEFTDTETLETLTDIRESLVRLIDTYKTGHSIAEGISTAIVGKPNVGKSSLYNLLCERDVAIVTDIEGTTRDVLEECVTLGGVMLRLADTAGIRSSVSDEVERIGIERSRARLRDCELLFAIFDVSLPEDERDRELVDELRTTNAVKIAIYNKIDKKCASHRLTDECFDLSLEISAKHNPDEARSIISDAVRSLFIDERISLSNDAVVSSARQKAELLEAAEAVSSAIAALEAGIPADAVSSDVEIALGALGRVDGRAVSDAVVNNIFSRFCVGK